MGTLSIPYPDSIPSLSSCSPIPYTKGAACELPPILTRLAPMPYHFPNRTHLDYIAQSPQQLSFDQSDQLTATVSVCDTVTTPAQRASLQHLSINTSDHTVPLLDLPHIPSSPTSHPPPPLPNPLTSNTYLLPSTPQSKSALILPTPNDELQPLIDFCLRETSNKGCISLVIINIRSIVGKMHTLSILSATVKPSFICLTETWLTHTINDSTIALPGYVIHRADRLTKPGGGCLIYCRSDLVVSLVADPIEAGPLESLCITITYSNPPLLLGCLYLPPGVPHSTHLISNFFAAICASPHPNKVLVGDFNLPNVSWNNRNTSSSDTPLAMQLSHDGWIQNICQPTRGTNILDLVFTNGDLTTHCSVGPQFPGSDHKIVVCNINSVQSLMPTAQLYRHAPTPTILQSISTLIRSTDWSDFFLSHDTQISANILYENILRILGLVLPPPKLRTRPHHGDKATLKLMRSLRRLRSEYRITKRFSLLLSINRIASRIQSSRILHELQQEKVTLSPPVDPSALSRLMRSRQPRNPDCITALCSEDGSLCTSPPTICHTLNTFFASCYSGAPKPPAADSNLPYPHQLISTDTCAKPLTTIPINLQDVTNQLRLIKSSSFPGPDGISASVLAGSGPDVPKLLHQMF